MIKRSAQKNIFDALLFALLIAIALMLGGIGRFFSIYGVYINDLGFILSTCIFIGLYSFWIISVYLRIMQSRVRDFLMLIGAAIIFWILIRTIKWSAFEFVIFEDRFLWYMYYIPMVMLSLFFFFIALYVGEDEEYRHDKRWGLLYIPAVLIILAVLTNDIHGLAFDINIDVHAYGQDYTHGVVYYIALAFILLMVLISSFIILRKFSSSRSVRKKALLPAIIIAITIIYSVLYIVTPTYGLGYYLDLTIFGCSMAIALLESFIRTGLIHSNIRHSECFSMASVGAQILNNEGEVVYISENALPLAKSDFKTLLKDKTISLAPAILSHIAPIQGGYVVWNSDVSQIKDMIENLKALNDKLYKEVDLLALENEQKSESARLQKINDLHGIMLNDILPLSERIKRDIEDTTPEKDIKRLLFKTSMSSTYIKRKVNLILTEQTEKCIYIEDMRYCFLESFQLLRLYDKTCAINITDDCDIGLDVAIICLDIYHKIIDITDYSFDTLYITLSFDESNIRFAVQISGDVKLCREDIVAEMTDGIKGELRVVDETDSYHISLTIPKHGTAKGGGV